MKTKNLKDFNLDMTVAVAEGWRWAKNVSIRSGDSYQPKDKPWFAVGARCLISPSKSKGLNKDQKNWDGWVKADMTEPLALMWHYEMPNYSSCWAAAGPIIEREQIAIDPCFHSAGHKYPQGKWYWIAQKLGENDMGYGEHEGDTALIAAMRAYVTSVFGDNVKVMKQLS